MKKHEEWSILQDIDDVVPLISKRVHPEIVSVFPVECIGHMVMLFLNCCKQKLGVLCSITFTMLIWLHVIISRPNFNLKECFAFIKKQVLKVRVGKPVCEFVPLVYRWCGSSMSSRRIQRLRASDNVPNEENIELSDSTLVKDFGIGTHAGGLDPGSAATGENTGNGVQLTYNFSNWVGSYTSAELAKLQLADPDINSILSYRQSSAIRPSRDVIAAVSPALRCLWLQWNQLSVKDGVLFRRYVSTDETKKL